MNKLKQKAIAYRAAKDDYNTAFREYFANQVTELPRDRFWGLQAVFRGEVCRFRFAYKRTDGIEQAAREFFRKPLAGDFAKQARYTFGEAFRFAKSWERWRRKLYQPLFDVVEDRDDDAYGDLLDVLPLVGREVIEQALGREFGNQEQFEAAVLVACDGNEQLAELILHGENYVQMSLVDAARVYFVANVRDGSTSGQDVA